MTKESKTQLRQETQTELTEKATIIEEAKRVARAMEHNPEEMRRAKLREMFPELSDQEIENLLEKA